MQQHMVAQALSKFKCRPVLKQFVTGAELLKLK